MAQGRRLQLALVELGMWRIRHARGAANVYGMYDAFGGTLIRDNLTQAVQIDSVTPGISVDEIARFIIHRFDGMVFEYAASGDQAACQRQADLLAEALVLLALPDRRAEPAATA